MMSDSMMTGWKKRISIFGNTLWNTLFWLVFTFFFGLLIQIVAILVTNRYLEPENITLFENIIMDGILLFFSLTLVSSVMIEYYQSKGISQMNDISMFVFFSVPVLICIFCAALFPTFYGQELTGKLKDYFEDILWYQMSILIVSYIYTISIKIDVFRSNQQIIETTSVINKLKVKKYWYLLFINK